MKKTLIFAFLLLPFFAQADFSTNLKYGAKGAAVTELQEFLIDGGYLASSATGNFYSLTLAAVKKFQTANSLPSSGYFGPMSRTIANTLLADETKDSTADEITQTGSTTAPSNTNAIDTLNQKITDLSGQIAQQKTAQDETNVKLGAIQQNTAPAPVVVVPVVAPVDKSAIVVKIEEASNSSKTTETPYGEYPITVSVLNSKGAYSTDASVTFARPSDDMNVVWNQANTKNINGVNNGVWSVPFTYIPSTPGTKTLTFTSGSLTKTVTVEVK